jgi:hypothetical protein
VKRLIPFGIVVALGVVWFVSLPPLPRALTAVPALPTVRGVIHVHTDRSDGTGTVDEVAAAAARAGVEFVILTDHGDGTSGALKPVYRSGVLMIDAVEISTAAGHVVALDLPATPYPLGGESRDVLEDIARSGGFAIAAHPESPKEELRWVDWDAPLDGLEWLNGDSEWRDESWQSLARVLFAYPARPVAALVGLLDRPSVLRRWDALTAQRRVVAVAAADAHARIGLRSMGEPYVDSTALPVPGYEQVFRAFSIGLVNVSLRRDADADARAIIDAIRGGHVYSVIDGIAGPAALSFTATDGLATAVMGDVAPLGATLKVTAQAPPEALIDLLRNGTTVASGQGSVLEYQAREPGAYRVEVSLPGRQNGPAPPWMLSNPIYVGHEAPAALSDDARPPARQFAAIYENGPAGEWTVETGSSARAALDVVPAPSGTQLLLRYALGGRPSENPYVALQVPAGPALPRHDRLLFTARASRPMRISVQLRMPGDDIGQRWHRSVYLDSTPRTVTVHFDEMIPRGPTDAARPPLSQVQSVLWVIDTLNTTLGDSGEVVLDDVRYGR